jgi:AbrB family looped-hinge helix DNA binding protein
MPTQKTQITEGGRIVIPAEYRKALGLQVGDEVMLTLDDGELRILAIEASIRRAQEIVSRYVPEGRSIVDEFIAERRAEAARE